jgi:hypothetical protein
MRAEKVAASFHGAARSRRAQATRRGWSDSGADRRQELVERRPGPLRPQGQALNPMAFAS